MKVLKFGGTSVGTVNSLRNVKKIIENIPGNAIIVVSALGGLTDKLIATAKMAASEDETWREEMDKIRSRHYDIIDNVVPRQLQEDIKRQVGDLLNDLERNYQGIYLLRALPEEILDVIVSFGERMSSIIVAAMVEGGKRYYSPDFIKTEKWYGKNAANVELTNDLIRETFKTLGNNEKAIVPGFISSDINDGHITNLGRGGSDYTGALIAAALDAEILEIWTDVDGFMTADPRIVKDTLLINHISFTESMELCTFGAKVIYPPTIYPVFHKNIPIKILNTFNLKAPGTIITEETISDEFEVKGVTSLKDIALIKIGVQKDGDTKELMNRAFRTLSYTATRMIPVVNVEPMNQLIFAVTAFDASNSVKELEKEFAPEIGNGRLKKPEFQDNLSAIAVVGKEMKRKMRLSERIRHSLIRQGIQVEALSAGNSDTTMVYIINQEKSPEAIPLIHSLMF